LYGQPGADISNTQPLLDTGNDMVNGIVLSVWPLVGKQERIVISERATKGICFFFSSGNHARKRKKEGTKCQKDNTLLGENYYGRQLKSRGECSKPTPPFTITASYVFPNIGTKM
jgi:hypothetical protein